jgi:hypothetical protein
MGGFSVPSVQLGELPAFGPFIDGMNCIAFIALKK